LGHNDQVRFVRFSPDSGRIVSASPLGDVCVWNADTGALVSGPLLRHAEGALAVTFRPENAYSPVPSDGKWIAVHDKNSRTIHVWDSKTGQLAVSFEGHTLFRQTASLSSLASLDKTIRIHTLDS
jgi:WD40 repeat protein